MKKPKREDFLIGQPITDAERDKALRIFLDRQVTLTREAKYQRAVELFDYENGRGR